jgi:hypothetical protein
MTPELVFYSKPEALLQDAVKLLEQPGVAIIAPSDIFTQKVMDLVSENFDNIGIFDARMTETARSKFWIQVLSGKYNSVI